MGDLKSHASSSEFSIRLVFSVAPTSTRIMVLPHDYIHLYVKKRVISGLL